MSAPLLMLAASFLFATMGVCVKLASAYYAAGEIVFYRALMGALMMGFLARSRGISLRTAVPGMHFWRSLSGVTALSLWFYSIGALTMLATGMHTHTLHGLVLLVAVGVLVTVAQLMMTRAYGIGRPLVNASLQYLGIAFSFGYGVLLFDDPLQWFAVGGIVLIVAAGLMATRLSAEKAPALSHSTLEP